MAMQKHTWFSRLSTVLFFLIPVVILSGCTLPWQGKTSSGIQIETGDVVASVFLNNEFVGSTPFIEKELKPDTYSVRLEPKAGELQQYETSVTLYPKTLSVLQWNFAESLDKTTGLQLELEPISSQKGKLTVTTIPDNVVFTLNGQSQGFTPSLMDDVSVGSYTLQLQLPGFAEMKQTVEINAGYHLHVTAKLAKLPPPENSNEAPANSEPESSPVATASATLTATASARVTPTSSPKASATLAPKASVSPTPKAATTSATTSLPKPYLTINTTPTGWLRVRSSAAGKELAQVDVGKSFPYFQTEDGWHEIEYETGKKGWVSGEYSEVVK